MLFTWDYSHPVSHIDLTMSHGRDSPRPSLLIRRRSPRMCPRWHPRNTMPFSSRAQWNLLLCSSEKDRVRLNAECFFAFSPHQLHGKLEGESGGVFYSLQLNGYLLPVCSGPNTVLAKYVDLWRRVKSGLCSPKMYYIMEIIEAMKEKHERVGI